MPSPSNQPKNPQNRSKLGSLSAVINKLQKNQELTGDVAKVPDAQQLVVNAGIYLLQIQFILVLFLIFNFLISIKLEHQEHLRIQNTQ